MVIINEELNLDHWNSEISANRTFLMGISIISIMLYHQTWLHGFFFDAFHVWGNLGVDVFFFLSGFGLCFSMRKHNISEFYKRRFLRLFPICVTCGILKFLWAEIAPDKLPTSVNDIKVIFGIDLWFIDFIILYYIIAPFLVKGLLKWPMFTMLGCFIIGIAAALQDKSYVLMLGLCRLPVFALGMLVVIHNDNFVSFLKKYGIIFVLLVLLIPHILLEEQMFFYKIVGVLFIIFSLSVYILSFYIAKSSILFERLKFKSPFLWVGRHSLELYLWHEFVYGFFSHCSFSALLSFLLSFSVSVCLAFVSNQLLDSIKHLSSLYVKK